jgi:peptidyl-prolyl cis-trans isomerase B (cyclophilin B)
MRTILLLVTIGLAAGLAAELPAQREGTSARVRAAAGARSAAPAAPTVEQIAAAKKQGRVQVKLATAKGDIQVELDGSAAPIAVANFLNLVKRGFYDGMPFHRVEPGFVIQAGDPALAKRPPVGYTIRDERSPIKHLRGTIAMARLYRNGQMVPNSASTQFYITLADTPHLDQMGFTAFGKVVAGMDVVDKIAVGDKIRKATVIAKKAHPAAAEAR